MDGNPSMRSPSESATHIACADYPHLSDPDQGAARCCYRYDYDGVVRDDTASAVIETAREQLCGKEREPLLRWLVEVDTAIAARRIFDNPSKVAFAMSCLGGRARGWAYGRRLTDATCLGTYVEFKEELRQAFEPLKKEFRSRGGILDLQQGKHDVHAYAQRARYLVSNIVTNPMDETTKVVTFIKGLRDGPVKTFLFREYPSTLEAAITLAMQEEFSLRQAKLHVNVPRMARPVIRTGGPEAMDLSNATAAGHQQRNNSSVRCFRCGYTGHFARECTATVHKAGGRHAGHRRDQ
ncbi:hypothetical protein PC119_g3880 [Phytophthora cactorum]|nr:hypothetical protein PC119_g3880 [Phytophthora cactorum]